jgi:hypothetical protein
MTRTRLLSLLVAATAATALLPTTASAAISVANAKPLSGVEGDAIEQRVVTFDDAGACAEDAYTVTINWGDGSSSAGELGKVVQATPATCSYDAEGEHVYRVAGTYAITATITRGGETVTTPIAGTATIRDAQVRGEGRTLTATAGQVLNGQIAELNDDNRLSVPGDFAATVDWGDGSAPTAAQINGNEGRFNVAGSHAYAAAGTYRYVVTVNHAGRSIVLDAGRVDVAPAGGGTTTTADSTNTPQATAALRALPSRLRLATLRRSGLRLRTSVAGFTGTRLAVRLRDARTGRSLGTARVRITAAHKRAGAATLRVRFSKATLAKLRRNRSYGVSIARQGGLPTQQVRITLR